LMESFKGIFTESKGKHHYNGINGLIHKTKFVGLSSSMAT